MRHHRPEGVANGEFHALQRLGEGPDLVDLDQDGVGGCRLDAAGQSLAVGDEQVVAHQLRSRPQRGGQLRPAVPVLLGHAVLHRHDGIGVAELPELVDHLIGVEGAPLAGQHVAAVGEELRGRHVQREGDVVAQRQAGPPGGLGQQRDRVGVGGQVGGEAALVAQTGGQAPGPQDSGQLVIHLYAPDQGLGVGGGPDGHHHELLEVDVVAGVRSPVDDVHHGHREHVGVGSAHMAPQRDLEFGRRGPGRGQRHAQDGVGAQARLGVGAVGVDERHVHGPLIRGVQTPHRAGQLADDVRDRAEYAPAPQAVAAVAQLDRLERPGGRP